MAGNSESKSIWALLKKEHSTEILVQYDASNDTWHEDKTQPKGVSSVTVNSLGLPAVISLDTSNHIFVK